MVSSFPIVDAIRWGWMTPRESNECNEPGLNEALSASTEICLERMHHHDALIDGAVKDSIVGGPAPPNGGNIIRQPALELGLTIERGDFSSSVDCRRSPAVPRCAA
jgi:hypothetical protein